MHIVANLVTYNIYGITCTDQIRVQYLISEVGATFKNYYHTHKLLSN